MCEKFEGRPHSTKVGLFPNGRCRLHGGGSLVGMAAPNYRGKGYSLLLGQKLREHYETAAVDPDWLSLREEIHLLKAQIAGLLSEHQETGDHIPRDAFTATVTVTRSWKQFLAAYRAGLEERIAASLTALEESITTLSAAMAPAQVESDLRAETRAIAVTLEKLKKTESTMRIAERGQVSLEQALADRHALITIMLGVITKHVGDKALQDTIRRETVAGYVRLTGRRDDQAVLPEGRPTVVSVIDSETDD